MGFLYDGTRCEHIPTLLPDFIFCPGTATACQWTLSSSSITLYEQLRASQVCWCEQAKLTSDAKAAEEFEEMREAGSHPPHKGDATQLPT